MRPLPALASLLLLGGAAALVPLWLGDYGIGVALSILMWVALAESWLVISGMTGYVSLGHAVFYGLGGYFCVLTWQSLPLPLALLGGGLTSGALALLVGYPVLRVRGPYFVILTFGLSELVKFIVINVEASLGVFSRLLIGGPSLETLYYVMLALAAAASALAWWVGRSRFGAGLRAIRENETAAETIGVPVGRFKLAAFALSAVIPGMVGAVMVLRSTYFEPMQLFDPVTSFTIVTVAILGGSDDVRGPLLGALFLTGLSELLWARAPQLYMILLGLLLVGFVLAAPDGIVGRLRRRTGTA
ncbi:MAG: branched-chain amino acid ABC transporter permease [Dongiaceae bacterium]